MKEAHLILLFDGTALCEADETLSNTRKIYECLTAAQVPSDEVQQANYYSGIGTSEGNFFNRTWSRVRGNGADAKLLQAYQDLCEFTAEHRDIRLRVSIEGFSRGFVVGLVLEKMVHKLGIMDFDKIAAAEGKEGLSDDEKKVLIADAYESVYISDRKPSHPEIQKYRETNSFPYLPEFHLFAFDPVAAFSNTKTLKPFRSVKDIDGDMHVVHGTKLPRSTKSYTELICLHEKRSAYDVLLVDFPEHYDIERTTRYFEGDHCSVGGGSRLREPLADVAGLEMLKHMQEKAGCHACRDMIDHLFDPDPVTCLDNKFGGAKFLAESFFYAATRFFVKMKERELEPVVEELHESVFVRQEAAQETRVLET